MKFEQLSIPVQIMVVQAVLIAVLTFLLVIYRKGLRATGKKFGVSVGIGEQKQPRKISPHASCEHRADALILLRDLWDIFEEKGELKYRTLIRRQMIVVEEAVGEISGVMMKTHLKLLEMAGFSSPVHTESYATYDMVLHIVRSNLVELIRGYVRENHFTDWSEAGYAGFVNERTADILSKINDLLNDFYPKNEIVTRSDVYRADREQQHKFDGILRDMFIKCRMMAIDTESRIAVLDGRKQAIFDRFIGDNET